MYVPIKKLRESGFPEIEIEAIIKEREDKFQQWKAKEQRKEKEWLEKPFRLLLWNALQKRISFSTKN